MVGLYNGLFLMGMYRTSEFRVWDAGVLVGDGEMGTAMGGGG